MAIEKRTLPDGTVVGFDTKRNCYCEPPENGVSPMDYEAYTIPQLRAFAEEKGIELGYNITRKDDIIAEIRQHLER